MYPKFYRLIWCEVQRKWPRLNLYHVLNDKQKVDSGNLMQPFIKIVGNGQKSARDLTPTEAEDAMTRIMDGRATPVQVAAFMAALRIKEESSQELATFTQVLR